MRQFKIVMPGALLLAVFSLAACNSGSQTPMTPFGPSGMTQQPGTAANMGGMGPGAGMGGMQVASEFDYLAEMIPHHDEAIATARLLFAGTKRQEMRTFALAIIETQTAEVEQMHAWLAAWYPGRDTRVNYQPMMRELAGLSGEALDRTFLEDMIPHHMMAVMMSQQLLMRGLAVHAEVNPFSSNIRDTQRREIQMMAGWLRDWFGAAPPMGHGR